jgi:uncharacterized membrane protein YccF (DUF307 family)
MPMEMTWFVSGGFWKILLNYNLPSVLWVVGAFLHIIGLPFSIGCWAVQVFGYCSGCGLTHDLAALIEFQKPQGLLVYFVVGGFLLNLFFSVSLAYRKCYLTLNGDKLNEQSVV